MKAIDFRGNSVLITGGAAGIGLACAENFAEAIARWHQGKEAAE